MIRFIDKKEILLIQLTNHEENIDIERYSKTVFKHVVLDVSFLRCSFAQMSKSVKTIVDLCFGNGCQLFCIVTRPTLLESVREYLRVMAEIDDIAYFNNVQAAYRYFKMQVK